MTYLITVLMSYSIILFHTINITVSLKLIPITNYKYDLGTISISYIVSEALRLSNDFKFLLSSDKYESTYIHVLHLFWAAIL